MIFSVFSKRIVGEIWLGLKTAIELRLRKDNVVKELLNDESDVVWPISYPDVKFNIPILYIEFKYNNSPRN